MNLHTNCVSKRLLPIHPLPPAGRIPLHGAFRTARFRQRPNPIMSTRPTVRRPLPVSKITVPRWNNNSSQETPPSSSGSTPSLHFSYPTYVEIIDKAITSTEDRINSEFANLRVSCSRALVAQQLRAEQLRAESIAYKRERDFAWAKVQSLMAEGVQIDHSRRRSKSCGPLSRTRSPRASAKPSRSASPHVSSQPLRPSASSSASSVQIKTEEVPISLTSSPVTSPISPTETLVGDDCWTSLLPDPYLSYPSPASTSVITLPLLRRCNSNSAVTKANLAALKVNPFRWIELPQKKGIPTTRVEAGRSDPLNGEHLSVIFKAHHDKHICRMCILQRKKLDKENQAVFKVASFDMHANMVDRYNHCLSFHPKESAEMVKVPRSTLLEMQKGFARTERDEDFESYCTHVDS